jgi:hypothetical protein
MQSTAKLAMSPREKHIPDDAVRTTVSLTAEDRAAINWIITSRRIAKSKRTTINDVLVDALWHFLEKAHGKTKEQVQSMVPVAPPDERPKTKITQMPKPRNKR